MSNNFVPGRLKLNKDKGYIDFRPIPKREVNYGGKRYLITRLPINPEALEKKEPGINSRIATADRNSIEFSLSQRTFKKVAQSYVRHHQDELESLDSILKLDDDEDLID